MLKPTESYVKTTFIYALCDPDTLTIRYVGKSDNPRKRLILHLLDKQKTHKVNWINKLKSQNKRPVLKILKEVEEQLWEEAEKKWIAHYRKICGNKLTNSTDGGEGVKNLTPESRRKMSESKKGHTVSKDQIRKFKETCRNRSKKEKEKIRKKLSESHKGQKINPEHLKRLIEINKNRIVSSETKRKMSKAQKGKKASLETRIKLSKATKAYFSNPDLKKRQSESTKAYFSNPDIRKKQSDRVKKQWADQNSGKNF